MTPIQIAQLLQVVIPLLAGVYKDVSGGIANMPPVEDLLKSADSNYQSIIDRANAELAKQVK